MPSCEAPFVELGGAPQSSSGLPSPTPSDISSNSSHSLEPQNIRAPPLFRVLAMPPPDPVQPAGQDELERRLPGYQRIVIPRELTLIELLKQSSGARTDEEVLQIREAKLRVVADRVGLRRLHILTPYLRTLILDGSALSSLRDLGIGLVHLKMLSVNRCGLATLDGIWGFGSLRELHAAGNRLESLQPLAALQKLHTLNLADNPIYDAGRLWMLAICGSLRRLTLKGTPLSDNPEYRSQVASALPLLNYLDDRTLHTDNEEINEELGDPSSSGSEAEEEEPTPALSQPPYDEMPGPSTSKEDDQEKEDPEEEPEDLKELEERLIGAKPLVKLHRRQRPATAEGIAPREKLQLPPRPKTAHERPTIEAPSRLQIMNTLMDEEWHCGASKLTSCKPVCGNIAQALRRPASARRTREQAAQRRLIESGLEVVERNLAEEIPHLSHLEAWERFKKETGIEIDLSKRPEEGDAESALDRLERIEKETAERLAKPQEFKEDFDVNDPRRSLFDPTQNELWKMTTFPTGPGSTSDLESLFQDIGLIRSPEDSLPD